MSKQYNYKLSADSITSLTRELSERFDPADRVVSVWVEPDSPYADVARSHELEFWPYAVETFAPYDDRSWFLLILDLRPDDPEIVHVARTTRSFDRETALERGRSGLAIIDDIMAVDQRPPVSFGDFVEFYTTRGIDLTNCVSLETNRTIHKRPLFNSLTASQIAYLTIYDLFRPALLEKGMVFASINVASARSFEKMGMRFEPFMDRHDIRVPTHSNEFDDDYVVVTLFAGGDNVPLLESVMDLAPPIVHLGQRLL